MKLQQLEYVIAIAQAGSITAAAKNLYQAQPNISIALKELESLHKSILKPVAINEVSRVQGEQLQILEENLLEVESVRNDAFKEQMEKKKSQVKAVKTSLVAKGSWENIVAALNAFEKKNLVVITGVDLERVADQLVMKMEYQTYYL